MTLIERRRNKQMIARRLEKKQFVDALLRVEQTEASQLEARELVERTRAAKSAPFLDRFRATATG